ncbi:MAG: hypothetical protein ACR2PZ_24185 [Pseudomonadales bacterium]
MGVISQLVAFLDALPNAGRGFLGGLLLLLLLLLFERWVARGARRDAKAEADNTDAPKGRLARLQRSFHGYRWRIAHTKTALLALLFVPLLIALTPHSRMPIYVETLPTNAVTSLHWFSALLALWFLIALILVVLQLVRWRADPQSIWQVPVLLVRRSSNEGGPTPALKFDQAPKALEARLSHWQRRLGDDSDVLVRVGSVLAPRGIDWPARVIDLPNASAHWPAAAVDVALIPQLCHFTLKHLPWLRFAALMGCLYWPFDFVRRALSERLISDFNVASRELAQSCYRDPLGFRRAEKQLQDRLGVAPHSEPAAPAEQKVLADDPYGRVFLTFVQMLLLVYVLTGTTLREIPDDSNFRYAEFVHDWYESFQRSAKYAPEEQTSNTGEQSPP